MRDDRFRYKVGECVTHVGFLKPRRQPVVQRFQVVAQTLEAAPSGPQRFYYLRSLDASGKPADTATNAVRVHEDHLATLPEDIEPETV